MSETPMRAAAFDLGTNTFRLLIGELVDDGGYREIHKEQIITRLGGGFTEGGELTPAARERALTVLGRWGARLAEYKVARQRAVATSVMRRAADSAAFAGLIQSETGIQPEIIDGAEEATLMLAGVAAGLKRRGVAVERGVVFDIGGGSTEFIACAGLRAAPPRPAFLKSCELGVVSLAEKFMRTDPPATGEVTAIEREARSILERVRDDIAAAPGWEGAAPWTLVGTAGTITSLCIIDQGLTEYLPERVTGYRLTEEAVRRIGARLQSLAMHERGALFPLGGGREDVIVPGGIITREALRAFGKDHLIVCDEGVLEGVLMSILQKEDDS